VASSSSTAELDASQGNELMTHRICCIPGDGIGHETIGAARAVLTAIGLSIEWVEAEAGWDTFCRCGTPLPPETLQAVRSCDATLFGAVSSPLSPVKGYKSPIVTMRRALDLFGNLRPVRSWPGVGTRRGIDMLIVRENSEGLYAGREYTDGKRAVTERVITEVGSRRIARLAFELAKGRRGYVTVVHKANVLRATCGLFRSTAMNVSRDHPAVTVDEMLVDSMAMELILHPQRFDVILTTNLFGDILSDEAAALAGGIGLAPSGNIGTRTAIFEPVHGSAPDIAGTGTANPVAAILACAMMLDYLHEARAAQRVREAVESALAHGACTRDLGGNLSTDEVTHAIIDRYRGVGPTSETVPPRMEGESG